MSAHTRAVVLLAVAALATIADGAAISVADYQAIVAGVGTIATGAARCPLANSHEPPPVLACA